MKKVLSVAMASAMVLGMGANAFAIQYNTSSNDEADWPSKFQFDGELFVTDKDGNIVVEATTALNDYEAVDFEEGDVIWMPLYAKNQLVYDAEYSRGEDDEEAINAIKLDDSAVKVATHATWQVYEKNGQYYNMRDNVYNVETGLPKGYIMVQTGVGTTGKSKGCPLYRAVKVTVNVPTDTIMFDGEERKVVANSVRYYVGATKVDADDFVQAMAEGKDGYITVNVEELEGADEEVGKPYVDEENGYRVAYGHYTGNIDKNWSVNLIEEDNGVAEMIEKAELYKATATDYASYSEFTDEIMPNAVYVRVHLKDTWKSCSTETLKYYVYVADNVDNNDNVTNKVWVSGNYAASNVKTVDFTWTNDASEAHVWKVAKNENGTAVFDFADKAFFSVKMYAGECMYLDLETAYDKIMAGDFDEAEQFFKFDNENANFSRTGVLMLVSDDSSLSVYEVTEDGYAPVDAEYVTDYAIAHTNEKVDGFVFETKQLGNYVLAPDGVVVDEDEDDNTQEVVVPDTDEEKTETNKPNPSTGAEDFVGLAVSLAVVSVAAAGALALKK